MKKSQSLNFKFLLIFSVIAVCSVMMLILSVQGLRSMKNDMHEFVNEVVNKNGSEEAKKNLEAELAKIESTYAQERNLMVVLCFVGLTVTFGFALYSLRSIRKSMEAVVASLEVSSESVADASEKIGSSAGKLSSAAIETSASLGETATATHEMTSMVQRNRENAERASVVSATSQASAAKGQKVMEEMARAIAEINSSNEEIMAQVNESNAKISEITNLISEIGEKTKIINDIVFQTKLLSFNASVEAARAGEHGRGFAVVAEEVGSLARMSGSAAKDISEMLASSIRRVETIVNDTKGRVEKLVRNGRDKVAAGTAIAKECSVVLEEIMQNVTTVTTMSNEIAQASQEQAHGVEEINKAMGQLDKVTQTNNLAADEAARAAENLSDQAKALKGAVQQIAILMKGGRGEVGAKAATQAVTKVTSSRGSSSSGSQGAPPSSSSNPMKKVEARPQPQKKSASSSQVAPKTPAKAKPKLAVVKEKPVKFSKPLVKSAPVDPVENSESKSLKLASGADVKIPSEDDPRFEDI